MKSTNHYSEKKNKICVAKISEIKPNFWIHRGHMDIKGKTEDNG